MAALVRQFGDRLGPPDRLRIARGPGRVNLIGEHTDYNGGFVLPIAIDRDVAIAFQPNGTRRVRLYSADFQQDAEFSLDQLQFDKEKRWTNYVRGVAHCLQQAGYQTLGFDGVIQGDVPIGAGLSSSASFEVASALAFLALSGASMDQFISIFAQAGHAVLIDCRSLDHQLVPLGGGGAKIVVCDTSVKRELAGSAYNVRRSQCEQAVRILNQAVGGIRLLRDVSLAVLQEHQSKLDPVVYRRARHVVSENNRTVAAVRILKAGDLERFGQLMNESHSSLRDDYEVSCRELDAMVQAARAVPGVYGARMTGAGFGGCTVNLVALHAVDAFCERVPRAYQAAAGREAKVYVCDPAPGARVETPTPALPCSPK
jgi:galactokinase